ncbi:MAG: alkaline serine protease [Massilia sp.]|jgi:tripeptidyl-peptidase-1|nr:alkaline serine protease [Massilia sp.]
MLPQVLFAAVATGLALASPLKKREVPDSHRLHERHLPHWSAQWTKRSKVPSTEMLPMRIGLKQSNLEVGREKLYEMWVETVPFGLRMRITC